MFGGIQDITKQKNDVYIYDFELKKWKKIHTTTNSVYDCSPTLKRQKKVQYLINKGFDKKPRENNIDKSVTLEEFNSSGRNEKDPKLKQAKEVPIA